MFILLATGLVLAWSARQLGLTTPSSDEGPTAGGLDDAQRLALLKSFRARAPGRARRQIALAVAAAPHIEAATALVDGLLTPNARIDRGGLAEALFRLADPRAEERILQRLPQADADQKENLLVALGKIGSSNAVDPLIAHVDDPTATVRVEAAHALGSVARSVHRAAPGEVVAGRVALIALLDSALLESGEIRPGGRNEVRAAIWALAQLDDPRAFAALREIAAQAERDAAVRDYATRILERPRVMLVLD